jgi:hypothetical protein
MNLKQLKGMDSGFRFKLVPAAYHLDEAGEPLLSEQQDWKIVTITDAYVELVSDSGCFCRLGGDHIKSFASDPQTGSADGQNRGFLLLLVQIYTQGTDVRLVPIARPGEALQPPINHALKARATFLPEMEHVFRRQIQILDRVLVNFITTANEYMGRTYPQRPGDTWESLEPARPTLFPENTRYRDLSSSDAELLTEFYGAVRDVAGLIHDFARTMALTEYNAWNVLMHRVQHSLRMGEKAVRTLCPDRPYDSTAPTWGTLLSRSDKALKAADDARTLYIEKLTAYHEAKKTRLTSHGRIGRR